MLLPLTAFINAVCSAKPVWCPHDLCMLLIFLVRAKLEVMLEVFDTMKRFANLRERKHRHTHTHTHTHRHTQTHTHTTLRARQKALNQESGDALLFLAPLL